MSLKKTSSIEIAAVTKGVETAKAFVGKRLKRSNISREVRSETLLVLDALLCNLLRQGFDPDMVITVETGSSFGEINISLGFEGKPFAAVMDEGGCPSAEDQILTEYADKFDYSYQAGYNTVHITIKRSFQNTLLFSFASLLLAMRL